VIGTRKSHGARRRGLTSSLDPSPGPATRTGGSLLVDCLLAHDVSLWTCVPGESFLPILDAIYDVQERADGPPLRLITARHEAAAANMAEAAGKLTGRAAVCLVTRGPGASHASIALHTAYQDGTPLVLVVGQVVRAHLGREAFQEMDFTRVFGSSAKSVVTVMDVGRIPEHVARAVHTAHSGRPGPVVLVVPEDVLTDRSAAPILRSPRVVPPEIARRERDTLLAELGRAQRPALMVGGPGWTQRTGDDVMRFAQANAVPVVSAFRWQDAVDNANPAYVGYLGLGCSPVLRQHLAQADLLVAFGPRLDDPTTDGYRMLDAPTRVVLVSQDPAELSRSTIPAVAIHAGLESTAALLAASMLAESPVRTEWLALLRSEQQRFVSAPATDLDVDAAAIVKHVRDTLPDDAVVTNGAGNYAVWLQRFFQFRRFGTQLAPRNGAMGYGVPAGLAAVAIAPDRTVVTFAGDGCFLMSGSELATAVQHELHLVIVLLNNSQFGTIRMHQERVYPGRVIATQLRNPDFVAYAQAFGALGLRVTKTADFPAAFAEAQRQAGPALIEVVTDPDQLTPDLRLSRPSSW
jgi:acetolactate synthase I/II/III large subunit